MSVFQGSERASQCSMGQDDSNMYQPGIEAGYDHDVNFVQDSWRVEYRISVYDVCGRRGHAPKTGR